MSPRIIHLIKKEFIQVMRDPRMLFIIFAAPVIQLIVLGYVATTEVKNLSFAVYDQDNSFHSRQIVEKFKGAGSFDVRYSISSYGQLRKLLDAGSARVALVVGRGFDKKIKRGETAPIQAIFDGSDANSAVVSSGYIASIMQDFSTSILDGRLAKKGIDMEWFGSLSNKARFWFNEELKSSNFMVPGVVGAILLIQIMTLSALGVVKEKEYGTLEQLIVTPIRPHELLIGKMTPYIIIAYVEVIFATLIAVFWFHVPFRGNPLLFLLLCGMFLMPTLGMGLFISLVSRTQYQAFLTSYLVSLPSIMLSGFIFPIENMPKVIQAFTHLLPLRYLVTVLRGIFLKGIGIQYLWKDVWPLLILGGLIFVLSVTRFEKKIS